MATKIDKALYSCEVCGQDGLTNDELREHLQCAHIEGISTCPFCDLIDLSPDEMVNHVNSAHLDYLSFHDENTTDPFIVTNGFGDHLIIDSPPQWENKIKGSKMTDKFIPFITNCDKDELNSYSKDNLKNKNQGNFESPSRSQLSLNINKKDILAIENRQTNLDDYSLFENNSIQCPMCSFKENSPNKLEEHVNRIHFDISPSYPAILPKNGSLITLSCPLCLKYFETTPDLELHVNIAHKDILSPAKASLPSPAGIESETHVCPVCNRSGFPSYTELALHIDTHFSRKPSIDGCLLENFGPSEIKDKKRIEHQEFSLLKAKYGMNNEGNFSQQSVSNMQRAVHSGEMSVSDYYERKTELIVAEQNGIDDGRSCSKGLLEPIRVVGESSNNVKDVWLCTSVDHYASTFGDRGWGCGYRNIQMLLSCLQHNTSYFNCLFSAPEQMPSISKIQKLIEKAWESGFDVQGCEQLGGRLFNSRKWIGATEVVALLSSFKIRCQLLDFHRHTGPDGTHPDLFKWCLEYFTKPADFKPPIYLQHQGHSRTIIGVEELKNGLSPRLLMLDPSHSPKQVSQLTNTRTSISAMRLIRKNLNNMKVKQYQMVVVVGLMQTETECNESKVLQSIRIPMI